MWIEKVNELPWQLQQQHSGWPTYDNQLHPNHHSYLDRSFWLPQSPDALCLYRQARLPPNSPPISTAKQPLLKSLKAQSYASIYYLMVISLE